MSRPVILIVDDDEDYRVTYGEVLSLHGYDPVAVSDGQAALEWLAREPAPALILLDLMMPVMTGWEFRRAQLADPRLAAIPVLVMTAGGYYAPEPPVVGARTLSKLTDVKEFLHIVADLTRHRPAE